MKTTLYLRVAVFFRGTQKGPTRPFICRFFKREKKGERKKASLPDVFSHSLSLFFHEALSVPAIPLSAFH